MQKTWEFIMSVSPDDEPSIQNQQLWHMIFAEGHPKLKSYQRFHKLLPAPPRCKLCFAPFAGIGGVIMRLRGKGRNRRNPAYCDACDSFLSAFPGGAEVELSMIFADVRGSVKIGEQMTPTDFNRIMSGFYARAAKALIETDGFILQAEGDHVVGVYPPAFSGSQHAQRAVTAAQHLLAAMHQVVSNTMRVPIGIGVHTGNVFIGTTIAGEAGVQAIHVLGDNVNIAARLAESAQPDEALISEAACSAAGLKIADLKRRELQLKGKAHPTIAWVLH
jgi:adenylate cyclase